MSRENIELHERFAAALNSREISDELADGLIGRDYRVESAATAVAGAVCNTSDWSAGGGGGSSRQGAARVLLVR